MAYDFATEYGLIGLEYHSVVQMRIFVDIEPCSIC